MIIKGKKLMLFLKEGTGNYKAIGLATNHTLSMDASTKELATKTKDTPDGKSWSDVEIDQLSWSVSAEALVGTDGNGGYSADALMDAFLNGTILSVELATTSTDGATSEAPHAVGTGYLQGSAIISKLTMNAPLDDNASYSIELQGKGALTRISA